MSGIELRQGFAPGVAPSQGAEDRKESERVDGGKEASGGSGQEEPATPSLEERLWDKFYANSFLIGVVAVILVAFAEPSIALALAPEITASWIAVIVIFILSGISLRSEDLAKAAGNMPFNLAVQLFNLGFLTIGVYGVAEFFRYTTALNTELLDGLVICAALPMTVNMVIVLTKSAHGDEAAAVFNSALGNILGVFLTPAWILALLGESSSVDFVDVILKLVYRVVIPLAMGQCIRNCSPTILAFYKDHKPRFKKLQEMLLVFIVFATFSRTFKSGVDVSGLDILATVAIQFVLLVIAKVLAWGYVGALFRDQPALRVMGFFGCVHKTVAMGIPLLDAIYSGDSRLGLYSLPLLVWHPLQLVIGSFLSPKLAAWVDEQELKADDASGGEGGDMLDGDVERSTPPTPQHTKEGAREKKEAATGPGDVHALVVSSSSELA